MDMSYVQPPPLVAQEDDDDIMKWFSDGSSPDLSSPDGSPLLVLEDSASPEDSPWRSDDALSVPMPDVSIDLPDLSFFQPGFEATEYATPFAQTESPTLSVPGSPVPLVPAVPSPTQQTMPPSVSVVPTHTHAQPLIMPKKVSRSKKRPRISEPPPVPSPESAEVALTREKLLQISSVSMERYVENLESSRALTLDDQKELKRQKRLIKNRESAQLSRERKRAYIDTLEDKIAQLVSENTLLKNDNMSLRQLLSQYQTVPTLVVSSKEAASITNIKPDPYATKMAGLLTSATSIGGNRPTSNTAKAGVCLLIVLFTFGLFMNSTPGPRGGSLIVKSPAVPDIIPAYHERTIGYKRSILEVLDEDDDYFEDPKQISYSSDKQLVPVKSSQAPRPMLQQPIQVKPAGIYKLSYSPEPAKFLAPEPSIRGTKIADDGNNSTYMLFLDPRPDLDNDGIPDPPPSDVQVSTHSHSGGVTAAESGRLPPMIITLVVPNHIANGSNPLFPKDGFITADSLMELTCQVVDVSITTSERPTHTHN